MAFTVSAKIKGSQQTYQLHPDCKKYTLRDYGFQETKRGNFEYVRAVHPTFSDSREVLFKMQVNQELTGLQLNVTTPNGLQSVDVYRGERFTPFADAIEALLSDMQENKVLALAE